MIKRQCKKALKQKEHTIFPYPMNLSILKDINTSSSHLRVAQAVPIAEWQNFSGSFVEVSYMEIRMHSP